MKNWRLYAYSVSRTRTCFCVSVNNKCGRCPLRGSSLYNFLGEDADWPTYFNNLSPSPKRFPPPQPPPPPPPHPSSGSAPDLGSSIEYVDPRWIVHVRLVQPTCVAEQTYLRESRTAGSSSNYNWHRSGVLMKEGFTSINTNVPLPQWAACIWLLCNYFPSNFDHSTTNV